MRLLHPYVIDTAVCFSHPSGSYYKPALRFLTQKYLNRTIQSNVNSLNQQPSGHCSVEDAQACLDLIKFRMAQGPEFGTSEDSEPLMNRLRRGMQPRKSAWVDGLKSCQREGANAVSDFISSLFCRVLFLCFDSRLINDY